MTRADRAFRPGLVALLGLAGVLGVLDRVIAAELPAAADTTSPAAVAEREGLPSFAQVRARHAAAHLLFTDRHGEPLQTLRVDLQQRRAEWVELGALSPALREAIVLGEDRHFWQHSGVDWRALAGAAWAQAFNQRTRGASTLTMQLAGLLDASLRRPAGGRGAWQKLRQMAAAAELEGRWSKAQILEAYLNLVPVRGELVGVAAAARQFFSKHPSGLDRLESAMLAALLRGPQAEAASVTRRACELLQRAEPGPGAERSCAGLGTLVSQALARREPEAPDGSALAPHFARYWLRQIEPARRRAAGGPLQLPLDARLQRVALQALRQQLAELQGRQVDDGAVVVLDNASGQVRAWVGSGGGPAGLEVDAVLARRQPGSTLKPFVYGRAFERGLIEPTSWLHDAPLHLPGSGDSFLPRNHDKQWHGWVRAREALGGSLNIPAVQVATMLGQEDLFRTLNRAGLRLRESAGYHGPALALGSAEVSLLDLSNAYRALANGGRYAAVGQAPEARAGGARRDALFSPAVAATLSEILADNSARAASFGFDNPLVTRLPAAVKTGTSKDMRDNWCIGYSRRFTVGVWIGNASGAPMHQVSGVIGAAPVWRRVFDAAHELLAAEDEHWPRPEAAWDAAPLARQTPAKVAAARQPVALEAFSITGIADQAVLALDPDIPAAAQRLRLEGPRGQWLVDGKPWAQGRRIDWPLVPGSHVIEVRDARRALLHRVAFTVRPGVRPAWPRAAPSPR